MSLLFYPFFTSATNVAKFYQNQSIFYDSKDYNKDDILKIWNEGIIQNEIENVTANEPVLLALKESKQNKIIYTPADVYSIIISRTFDTNKNIKYKNTEKYLLEFQDYIEHIKRYFDNQSSLEKWIEYGFQNVGKSFDQILDSKLVNTNISYKMNSFILRICFWCCIATEMATYFNLRKLNYQLPAGFLPNNIDLILPDYMHYQNNPTDVIPLQYIWNALQIPIEYIKDQLTKSVYNYIQQILPIKSNLDINGFNESYQDVMKMDEAFATFPNEVIALFKNGLYYGHIYRYTHNIQNGAIFEDADDSICRLIGIRKSLFYALHMNDKGFADKMLYAALQSCELKSKVGAFIFQPLASMQKIFTKQLQEHTLSGFTLNESKNPSYFIMLTNQLPRIPVYIDKNIKISVNTLVTQSKSKLVLRQERTCQSFSDTDPSILVPAIYMNEVEPKIQLVCMNREDLQIQLAEARVNTSNYIKSISIPNLPDLQFMRLPKQPWIAVLDYIYYFLQKPQQTTATTT